jgi:hypothetical protein
MSNPDGIVRSGKFCARQTWFEIWFTCFESANQLKTSTRRTSACHLRNRKRKRAERTRDLVDSFMPHRHAG